MELLEAALAYLDEGRSVFPVRVDKAGAKYSKRPLCPRPMEKAFTSSELIALWPSEANAIGMECGKVSGVLRLDAEGPVPWAEIGDPPKTGRFKTVSGGSGWLLSYMDGAVTTRIWKGDDQHQELRVQSDGSFTVVPPSWGYEWTGDKVLSKVPRWLYDMYIAQALASLTKDCRPTMRQPEKADILEALKYIPSDEYDEWIKVGMALKSADMYDEWIEWSKKSTKFVEAECEKKWGTFSKVGRTVTLRSIPYWAERYGYEMPNKHESITELGFSRVLANINEGIICHSSVWGWLAWDGQKWDREDAYKTVTEKQTKVIDDRDEAATQSLIQHLLGDKSASDFDAVTKRKQKTLAAIKKHKDYRHISGARKIAESNPKLTTNHRYFDCSPMLLNCTNGTLDLTSGELREHNSSDMLTQHCPTAYQPLTKCDRWLQFLDEVFVEQELVEFMQRLLGYCITGCTQHHILPIWYGTGRNGKSTLVKVMLTVLGKDYAGTMPSGFLAQYRYEQHPAKTVQLYGKRFTADMETGDSMKLNEEYVKRITGGDELTARGMRENYWSFNPTHKLVLATNYEPSIKNQDPAIWNRILKVPFNACFAGREEFGLDEALRSEAEGILAWLVEGCMRWQRDGLTPPACITGATEAYMQEQNTVKSFFEQMLRITSEEQRTKKNVIVAAYKAWCITNSYSPVSPKAFGMSIAKLGVQSDNNNYWVKLNS